MDADLVQIGSQENVVLEIGPLGCYPAILKSHKLETKYAKTQMVSTFNRKLKHMIEALRSVHNDATIITAKTYSFIFDMMERPSVSGRKLMHAVKSVTMILCSKACGFARELWSDRAKCSA